MHSAATQPEIHPIFISAFYSLFPVLYSLLLPHPVLDGCTPPAALQSAAARGLPIADGASPRWPSAALPGETSACLRANPASLDRSASRFPASRKPGQTKARLWPLLLRRSPAARRREPADKRY